MKKLLQTVGLWLAKLGGYERQVAFEAKQAAIDEYRELVVDAEQYFHNAKNIVSNLEAKLQSAVSGEYKHAEAFRVLLNQFPYAVKNDLHLAIELAVKKCSTHSLSGR